MARYIKKRDNSQGKAPGSLIFIGKHKMEKAEIHRIRFNKSEIEETPNPGTFEIAELPSGPAITWINIYGLHDTAIFEVFGEQFGISPLALEDILNTDERPKLIEDKDKLIVILKTLEFNPQKKMILSEQISMVIGSNYLLTFQERPGDFFESVRERLRDSRGKIRCLGADYLAYALIDSLVDAYIHSIEKLGSAIEELENRVLKNSGKETAEEIYRMKIEVSFIRKSIRPVKEIVLMLLQSDLGIIDKKNITYLKDLEDLATQANEATDMYYTMTNDLLNIYHTNLTHKANEVMKFLTIFASIFIPLTFIAGVYGTNFDFLPELHFKYSYFIMLGVMLLVAAAMLRYFRKKRWL